MNAVESLTVPVVRRMKELDLDVVMAIERASFSTPWSRGNFRNLLVRGDADLWVAVVEEAVVGYAVVWYVLPEAELGNLAVDAGWRRQGLGRTLLDWVLTRADDRGAERIFLEVRVSNRHAQGLYERRGFIQVGIRRRYYRAPVEDARVLCLDLRAGE